MATLRRILLADDDRSLRLGVAELLGALGQELGLSLEVVQAETGQEALEIARSTVVHAALLDLHMPEKTGIEVMPLLRVVHAELPCLIYSGDLTTALEQSARDAGAFAVLHKPVDPMLLRSEVSRALRAGPPAA